MNKSLLQKKDSRLSRKSGLKLSRKKTLSELPLDQPKHVLDSPDTLKYPLNNGLQVVLHRIPVIDMASVYLRVNTGSNYEGRFLGSGISHFLEHCMFLGSKKFPGKDQFSNLIQGYGGIDLNAFTGETSTCYQFSVLSRYLIPALEALHDFIFHPLLRKKDVEEERGTIVSEMDLYDDKAADWFYRLVFSHIFSGEPTELPIIGLRKLFNRVTVADLREYHSTTYRPDNISLCLVGHFNVAKVNRYLKKTFASPLKETETEMGEAGFYPGGQKGYWTPSPWPRLGSNPILSSPRSSASTYSKGEAPIPTLSVTETYHHRVEFVRATLVWEGCDFFDPDNYTLDIVSHILASGRGSILYEILKEKLGWVEKISTFSLQPHTHSPGRFFVEFTLPQCNNQREVTDLTHKVTEKIVQVLKQIGHHLTQEILDGSRNTFLKAFIDEKEDFIDVASALSHSLNYYGHLNYEKEYFSHINRLSLEVTLQAVKKYLHPLPHLFLLLPKKIFQQGATFSAHPNFKRVARDFLDFEKSLEKRIPDYKWNGIPAKEEKPSVTPSILSARDLHPTSKKTLNNQATLLYKKINGLPKICLQLIFPGGSSWEGGPYRNGSFNLLSQMFFASNRVHSKKEIAKGLRHYGIIYNSFGGENTFGLGFSFLKDRLPALLSCLEPILTNTRYRESDFAKEKKEVLYALIKSREDSFREAMRQFKKHFFGDSGLGLDPRGDEQNLPLITSREVIDLKKKYVIASHLTAHLCGDFTSTDLRRVEQVLSQLDQGGPLPPVPESPRLPDLNYQNSGSLMHTKEPGGQSHFLMGYRVPALGEGNGALKLVNHYLEGIGGPLFKLRSSNFVKDGKNLGGRSYRLGCFIKTSKYYGMMVFYVSFRKEAENEYLWALDAFQKELDRLRRHLIDDKELERAKTSILAEMKTQSIKYDLLSLNEGLLETYGLGHDFGEKETAQLQSLNAGDLREAVNRYLGRDNFLGYVMTPDTSKV